jgi:gluconate kinase
MEPLIVREREDWVKEIGYAAINEVEKDRCVLIICETIEKVSDVQ